jgi:dipeptidyl aminopeptidase/acylaminoacyl peptidase
VRAHRKVPVWVFHGEKDDVVEVEQSQRMVDAMKKARAPVKFSRDPEGDHGIGGQVFNDGEMHEWLFQQKRS